jgi:hypothetical protein
VKTKVVHRAGWLNDKGHCRPRCRPNGPKVNYAKEQSTTVDKYVTCKKCMRCAGLSVRPA